MDVSAHALEEHFGSYGAPVIGIREALGGGQDYLCIQHSSAAYEMFKTAKAIVYPEPLFF